MNFKEQEANRQWLLETLANLIVFTESDSDFHGNRAHERKTLGLHRAYVEDGKYRVVFMGTFNVGKSTAINAFLGGAYLPMDVEECTSRLTFIQRGDRLRLELRLLAPASTAEVGALREVLDQACPGIEVTEADGRIQLLYTSEDPEALRNSLEPLVTITADERFPALQTLRVKLDELHISLPASVLEEDILFVDTPGVHTISETRQEITYGVIERCHLVIDFVDSGFVGNIHDLDFIKRIIKWRGRRVFFVLNKADKLEPEEIDPSGQHGPARVLLDSFQRHEIPDSDEIHFLSGYQALRAIQLQRGDISLDTLREDNKAGLPENVLEDPAQVAAQLLEQSHFPMLKARVLDFLLHENKAATVLEGAAKFLQGRADDYAVPLENELALAKDPSKFEELRANRETLTEQLNGVRAAAIDTLNSHSIECQGGKINGSAYEGFEQHFRKTLTNDTIAGRVVQPTIAWLREAGNLKASRRKRFQPLSARLEHHVDEFVSRLVADLQEKMTTTESAVSKRIEEKLGEVRGLRMHMAGRTPPEIGLNIASQTNAFQQSSPSGAVLGAALGASIGSVAPFIGTAIGAGIGGLLGATANLFYRMTWREEQWIERIEPLVRENAMRILLLGVLNENGARVTPVAEVVRDYVRRRTDVFQETLQAEVDTAVATVQQEIDSLLAREKEIRQEREAILSRLEPKVAHLHEVRDRCRDLAAGTTMEIATS